MYVREREAEILRKPCLKSEKADYYTNFGLIFPPIVTLRCIGYIKQKYLSSTLKHSSRCLHSHCNSETSEDHLLKAIIILKLLLICAIVIERLNTSIQYVL